MPRTWVEETPSADVMERFSAVLADDLDVAGGLGVLFETVREGNRRLDAGEDAGAQVAAYDEIVGVFGLAEPTLDVSDLTRELAAVADRSDRVEVQLHQGRRVPRQNPLCPLCRSG